jgi:hypothetical protein
MTTHPPDPLDMLVDAILQSYGQLALLLEHMLRAAGEESEPIPDVLRQLLRDVLVPLAERRGDTDVAVAAELLAAATDAIGTELYLVPVDELRANGRAGGAEG